MGFPDNKGFPREKFGLPLNSVRLGRPTCPKCGRHLHYLSCP